MSNRAIRRSPPATVEGGRVRQKKRTKGLLLTAARSLIAAGRRPTVAEVADAAEVSRRTAYRYFPTQMKLMSDAALEGLRPVMEAAIAAAPSGGNTDDVEARVDAMSEKMMRLAFEHEPLLRTMIHETVLHQGGGDARRWGRRMEWIEMAVAPMRAQLGATAYKRLLSALGLCVGIEALLVLRDICGLSQGQTIQVSQWMARAVIRQSLAERKTARRR
jgi:AcrR family transcriptional regulator